MISACVLDEVDLATRTSSALLRSLNERNRSLPYGKFFFDRPRGEIQVEYELLGDHLQDAEFMNALTTVAELADDHDDLLKQELATVVGPPTADRRARGLGESD